MPLVPDALASSLESQWLVPEGGTYPSSVAESAQHFAGAVAQWFAGAMASGFPCATAQARQAQLAASATGAFNAQSAATAGSLLAVGLTGYLAGQAFGPGVAAPPAGVAAAQAAFTGIFADLDSSNSARARQMASGIHTLVLTVIVAFPPPMPPSPVL